MPYERLSEIHETVPRNKLQGRKAGIAIRTNYSLCATSASDMFRAGIPEKVIQSHTGHRSLKALRMYEKHYRRKTLLHAMFLYRKEMCPLCVHLSKILALSVI